VRVVYCVDFVEVFRVSYRLVMIALFLFDRLVVRFVVFWTWLLTI